MENNSRNPVLFENLLAQIDTSDSLQLQQLIHAIIKRRKQLYPDWETVLMYLPVDPHLRKKDLDDMLPLLYHTPK